MTGGRLVVSQGSWQAALHGGGGACALAAALLAGEADLGFSLPVLRATTAGLDTTPGFCLFNKVARRGGVEESAAALGIERTRSTYASACRAQRPSLVASGAARRS